ncbi:MAG TPA: Crp/Fnr family transcriptional regulator [Xanthobacteraceae bacterium]|nr:Crp/Fnr family transcriptional regulator [Xanthobacteraceae bacterium]
MTSLFANVSGRATLLTPGADKIIFTQGDPANSVFYIEKGKVKVTVLSPEGKKAVLAILNSGEFFGEGCLTDHPQRLATVSTMTACQIVRLEKAAVIRLLHEDRTFSEIFMSFLLERNIRVEEDLTDQLFNSSEKRLARILLLLAKFGKAGKPELVIPKVSQETLAQMVGTTRGRVNTFMNKFRHLGFIEYDGDIKVHSSLLNVILHD